MENIDYLSHLVDIHNTINVPVIQKIAGLKFDYNLTVYVHTNPLILAIPCVVITTLINKISICEHPQN